MQADWDQIPFLHVIIYRTSDDTITVRPYRKPMDCNTYLHFKSFYPGHLCSNLPYRQFFWIKRNSTDAADFRKGREILCQQLILKGYLHAVINQTKERADSIPRLKVLKDQSKSRQERVRCIFNCIPMANSIRKSVLCHWNLLFRIPGYEIPPSFGFRRTRSIWDMITQSNFY